MGKIKNIVLIGFMGVGKGRTARELAERTGKFAVDCDDLIESFSNCKVKNIFAKFGESRFRELEKEVALWLEKHVQNSIISTGGGFLQVPNLEKIGTVVYLHSDFNQILAAIRNHPNSKKKIKKRPLLQNVDAAKDIHSKRLPLYRAAADIEIDVAQKSIAETCDEIVQLLEKKNTKKTSKK